MSRDRNMLVISELLLMAIIASSLEMKQEVRLDNPVCSDAKAKEFACKLLVLADNGDIVLWKKHPSGVHDNAYAYNNIRDTCHGYAAARSNYTCKECPSPGAPGGFVCLNATLVQYIYTVHEKIGFVRVNEIAGACHSCRSKHYLGRAVDLHSASKNQTSIMLKTCVDMGGWGQDEKSHVHCQFNP